MSNWMTLGPATSAKRNSHHPSPSAASSKGRSVQGGPDHFIRVASEDVYSWIEQLNPTVNVLRAYSANPGDGARAVLGESESGSELDS